jgi:hypothetical protein
LIALHGFWQNDHDRPCFFVSSNKSAWGKLLPERLTVKPALLAFAMAFRFDLLKTTSKWL